MGPVSHEAGPAQRHGSPVSRDFPVGPVNPPVGFFCSRPQLDLIPKGPDTFKSWFSDSIQRTDETTSFPGGPCESRARLGLPVQSTALGDSP